MKRKWAIFKEYYLAKSIIVIILVAGVIYFCYDRINKKDSALQVVMLDVRCSMEQQEEFENAVGEIINMDKQKEYVDISFCESPEMLLALMANNQVDLFLLTNSYFEMMLSQECLYPLDEIIEKEEQSTFFKDENGTIYGYSVSDNPWMKQFEFVSTDDVIVCIVENGPGIENACTFVRSLLTH